MSHEVETMMFVGQTPWHKLGFYVGDKEITSKEAIVAAGLDWKVELKKLYADSATGPILCPDNFATVRLSDNSILGVVGNRYTPVQNAEQFEFFDSIVGEKLAMYHTAGSLKNGKIVWILAKLPDSIKVKGKDHIEKYLILSTSHDGSLCLRVHFSSVRTVCFNTLMSSLSEFDSKEGVVIRHTANVMNKLEQARETLGFAVNYYKELELKLNFLADQKFTDLQVKLALQKLFPAKDETDVPTRTENMRNTVLSLYYNKPDLKEWQGTAYGFMNSITDFVSHHRSLKDQDNKESRMLSNVFGSGAQLSAKSFDLIVKMAGDSSFNPNLRA